MTTYQHDETRFAARRVDDTATVERPKLLDEETVETSRPYDAASWWAGTRPPRTPTGRHATRCGASVAYSEYGEEPQRHVCVRAPHSPRVRHRDADGFLWSLRHHDCD